MLAAMAVLLEAIRFTHDPGSPTTSTVRLRRNAADAVFVPEWRRGVSFRPEDAPAAFAVSLTRIHPVTIQAQIAGPIRPSSAWKSVPSIVRTRRPAAASTRSCTDSVSPPHRRRPPWAAFSAT
jgi:hypothetical protein